MYKLIDRPLTWLALISIRFYRRYLSPIKGYRCAYGVLYHGESCSDRVMSIILSHGVTSGWPHIKHQFNCCTQAYEALQQKNAKDEDDKKKKKRDKDSGCFDNVTSVCDAVSCLPSPLRLCKGKNIDGDAGCDLPCDCSP